MKSLIFLVLIFVLSKSRLLPQDSPLKPVKDLNLELLSGRWYQLGRLSFDFETKCACSVIKFALDLGDILQIESDCHWGSPSGKTVLVTGKVIPQDPVKDDVTTGKLEFDFPKEIDVPFYVFGLHTGYEWALLGNPDRKYLWILTKRPSVDDNLFELLVKMSEEAGFDIEKLVHVDQSNQCFQREMIF